MRSADAELAVRGIDVRALHEAVRQSRLVREQVADRHRAINWSREEVRVVPALEDPEIAPLGDELVDRVVELEVPPLVELHQRHRRDRLGHRVDPEDRVGTHRASALAVHQTLGRKVRGPAATRDEGQAAGDLPGLQVAAAEMIVDSGQLGGAEADVFRDGQVELGGGVPQGGRGRHREDPLKSSG